MKKGMIIAVALALLLCSVPGWAAEKIVVSETKKGQETVQVDTAVASASFEEKFLKEGETPMIKEMAYYSQDVVIEITAVRENRSDIYVADIYLRDVQLLRRGFGGGRWNGKQQRVEKIAQQEGAILALTGDNGHNFRKGIVFANGQRLRKTNPGRQQCVIFADGEMRTYPSKEISMKVLEDTGKEVWQTFLFGPALLDAEGHAIPKFTSQVSVANPRAVIGYFEPGHYCLVQVDGRGAKSALESGRRSVGLTLKQLSQFMENLGCKAAYNLDGGQSALMWFNGRVLSTPYKNGRSVGDIVYIQGSK